MQDTAMHLMSELDRSKGYLSKVCACGFVGSILFSLVTGLKLRAKNDMRLPGTTAV